MARAPQPRGRSLGRLIAGFALVQSVLFGQSHPSTPTAATSGPVYHLQLGSDGVVARPGSVPGLANTSAARIKDVLAAERINAQAMREFQQRFERHLRNPRSAPLPVLYPTRVELFLENTR
jgi:hypothetical protein